MPARDANLYFRASTAGNLTGTEAATTHIIDLGPSWSHQPSGPLHELVLWLEIPSVAGTATPTVIPDLRFDDDSALGSPDAVYTYESITAAGYYEYPFMVPMSWMDGKGTRYVGLTLTVSGTNPNFGAVQAGISQARSRMKQTIP